MHNLLIVIQVVVGDLAFAMRLSIHKIAGVVGGSKVGVKRSLALLNVVDPVAVIHGSLVDLNTISMSLVILPIALVHAVGSVVISASPVEHTLVMKALIHCTVLELDDTQASIRFEVLLRSEKRIKT